MPSYEGILPIYKPRSKTSFSLVSLLRKITSIRTIGHAGTLDPFAEGVMVLLIGRKFTKLSNAFLHQDKEYVATIHLGISTDTYDCEGKMEENSSYIPSLKEIEVALQQFQGTTLQTPPMFSAKKIDGKKLYELARKGITIERLPCAVKMHIDLLDYQYPHLKLHIACSKGTYIRSLAHDLGKVLTCGAHLTELVRTRSGSVTLEQCCDPRQLLEPGYDWASFLKEDIQAHVAHSR